MELPVGRKATVAAPATTANLGPGFDSLGFALAWADTVSVEVIDSGVEIEVTGQGASNIPMDENHLVIRVIRKALGDLGATAPGLRYRAHNTIPFASGLGSSAAAIVSGLGLAWSLAKPDTPFDREWIFRRAAAAEGHPDNVAPATYGGLTISWGLNSDQVALVGVHSRVRATALCISDTLETKRSRAALPEAIPFEDAARNSARTALLVHALAKDPDLLYAGTEDFLHQRYRQDLYPDSYELVRDLREQGLAATVSGAGPAVVIFHRDDETASVLKAVSSLGHVIRTLAVGGGVRLID